MDKIKCFEQRDRPGRHDSEDDEGLLVACVGFQLIRLFTWLNREHSAKLCRRQSDRNHYKVNRVSTNKVVLYGVRKYRSRQRRFDRTTRTVDAVVWFKPLTAPSVLRFGADAVIYSSTHAMKGIHTE